MYEIHVPSSISFHVSRVAKLKLGNFTELKLQVGIRTKEFEQQIKVKSFIDYLGKQLQSIARRS